MWDTVLIDANVMMDALLEFRPRYTNARRLLQVLAVRSAKILVPSHAYFEYAVTVIVHWKNEPEKLQQTNFGELGKYPIHWVTLDERYVGKLIDDMAKAPIPDLKSADMIYFCITRDRGVTLVTQDRKLRNVSRQAGLRAFEIDEALAAVEAS